MSFPYYVSVRLPERAGGKSGEKWSPVRILSVGRCRHEQSICKSCIESWNHDYDLRINSTARRLLLIKDWVYVIEASFPNAPDFTNYWLPRGEPDLAITG
jgi:hypothetical protein